MRIAFRTDASRLIGTGHLVRCRTLAQELVRRGATVEFICRRHGDEVSGLIESSGLPVHYLPPASLPAAEGQGYESWLGASEDEDSRQTAALLAPIRADWLVVDHYGLSDRWERSSRPHVGKILSIDDLARSHACDALLDQNFARDPDARYHGRVPAESRLLLGPRYALLHESYAKAGHRRNEGGPVRRIAIFFGGVDAQDFTGTTLAGLDHPSLAGVALDVVLGSSSVHADRVAAYKPDHVSIQVHRALPTLAGILGAADLAIGAGGGNTWERCCCGVPSITISLAENQTPASEALSEAGIVEYLGHAGKVSGSDIRAAVLALAADPSRRQAMSEQGQLLVDGRGAARVAESLFPTAPEALTLRPATQFDLGYVFQYANDPFVRAQSFSTEYIPWERHKRWFSGKLADPGAHIFILEAQGLPTGMIRFDIAANHATLNYGLDATGRGKKWGGALVELGLRALARVWTGEVHALVKRSNAPSCAIFERLLFRSAETSDDHRLYILDGRELRLRFGS